MVTCKTEPHFFFIVFCIQFLLFSNELYVYILAKSSNRPLFNLRKKIKPKIFFYENLYIASQVSYLLIAFVIFQILSNTQRAIGKCSKKKKARPCSSKDYIYRNFYHTIQLLNVSLKRKTENISIIMRHVTTEKRAKGIFMLQNGVD